MMTLDMTTLAIIGGLVINFLAIVASSNRHERRLTRIETVVSILARRSGIHLRIDDDILEKSEG